MTISSLLNISCFASVQEPDRRAEKLGGKVAHAASEWWAGAVAPSKVHCKLSILDKDCIGRSQMPTGLALLNFSAVPNKDYKNQFQSYNVNSNVILDYLKTQVSYHALVDMIYSSPVLNSIWRDMLRWRWNIWSKFAAWKPNISDILQTFQRRIKIANYQLIQIALILLKIINCYTICVWMSGG